MTMHNNNTMQHIKYTKININKNNNIVKKIIRPHVYLI